MTHRRLTTTLIAAIALLMAGTGSASAAEAGVSDKFAQVQARLQARGIDAVDVAAGRLADINDDDRIDFAGDALRGGSQGEDVVFGLRAGSQGEDVVFG